MRWLGLFCVALMSLLGLQTADAGAPSKKASPPQAIAQAPVAAPPVMTIQPAALRLLIYTSLIAVNQANLTGNYTVLRDLAAPGFREANSAARLTEIFSGLRNRKLDLSPILLLDPKLVRRPTRMDNGLLRLSGFFPSAPEQVNFDLAFQLVGGRWLLFGVALNTSPAATATGPATNRPPASVPVEPATSATATTPSAASANAMPDGKTPGWVFSGVGAAPPPVQKP